MPDTPTHGPAGDGKKPHGAPLGNENGHGNVRHGLKAGKLPPKCQYIEHQMNGLRRQLEKAVLEAKGAITLLDAAAIQTAMKWERHGALALRWLRLEGDALKPSDRLAFSREIARASSERDKALKDLHLDRDSKDSIIDALYKRLPAPNGDGTDEPD